MKVISRRMVFATIIVLTLVSISVTSAFAASLVHGSNVRNLDQGLESRWESELTTLQRYKFLDNQIAKWLSEWLKTYPSPHKRARRNRYANAVQLALQQAEIIVAKHAGFDAQGRVTDKIQATQSVQNLAIYLHELHIDFIHKFHHRLHKH